MKILNGVKCYLLFIFAILFASSAVVVSGTHAQHQQYRQASYSSYGFPKQRASRGKIFQQFEEASLP